MGQGLLKQVTCKPHAIKDKKRRQRSESVIQPGLGNKGWQRQEKDLGILPSKPSGISTPFLPLPSPLLPPALLPS